MEDVTKCHTERKWGLSIDNSVHMSLWSMRKQRNYGVTNTKFTGTEFGQFYVWDILGSIILKISKKMFQIWPSIFPFNKMTFLWQWKETVTTNGCHKIGHLMCFTWRILGILENVSKPALLKLLVTKAFCVMSFYKK